MLCRIFLKLAGMSVTAGVLVLAILAVRALTRRRMPKWAHCLLWGLVAACLLCPVLPESGLSLRPQSGELVQYGDQLTGLDREPVIILMETGVQDVYAFRTGEADRPGVSLMPLAYVWLAGMAVLLGWAAFSWLRLRRQVAASIRVGEQVYLCDDISSPFILGIFRPRVYLPSGLEGETLQSVLRHEGAHLRRRDHWWKPLGHLLVAVYWFHPLIWAAYVLLCRDIELACDERVVRDMNRAQRAAYSQALLDCAMTRRRRLVLCPLAFGEVGVRDRVKSVLHYRRPGVWLSAAAVLLCAALAMTFLTEPKPARTGVSPEAASGQTDPDRLRETSSKALIVSSTLDPAAQRVSYTVQLTEEPEDWIAQKQWYGVASYADVEIFYPTAGSYYRQTDVPHLRFYEWGLADQPTDLESQRPDMGTRYNDYIVDSVTVLSVDGEQRSTFRRVGQSLLLEEDTRYSGGSVSFHAWLQ